jgi:hypothetical protein
MAANFAKLPELLKRVGSTNDRDNADGAQSDPSRLEGIGASGPRGALILHGGKRLSGFAPVLGVCLAEVDRRRRDRQINE